MHAFLQQTQDEIENAVSGMHGAQFTSHAEGKWSAANILEHLARAFSSSVPHLKKCLEGGRPTATPASLWQCLATALVVGVGYFPSGRRAPDFTLPQGMPAQESLALIRSSLAAMDDVLNQCQRRFGGRTKLANHPVLGPFSVRQWRKFHWVHTHHHMKQIARLREADRRAAQSSP